MIQSTDSSLMNLVVVVRVSRHTGAWLHSVGPGQVLSPMINDLRVSDSRPGNV